MASSILVRIFITCMVASYIFNSLLSIKFGFRLEFYQVYALSLFIGLINYSQSSIKIKSASECYSSTLDEIYLSGLALLLGYVINIFVWG